MTKIRRRDAMRLIGATSLLGMGHAAVAEPQVRRREPQKFVLVHGAWHAGFAWDGVASRLRIAGHDAKAPTLPGMTPGENRFGIQFSDYVQAVVEVLRRQDKPAIIVGHSSAGMLMQAAAPQAAGAIKMLVFSNAFIAGDGQNQLDNIPPDAAAALTALSRTTIDNTVPVKPIDGFLRTALIRATGTGCRTQFGSSSLVHSTTASCSSQSQTPSHVGHRV